MQLTKGTRLGPYEIIAPLGAGGMGEVYRARDSRLGRFVAIKIVALDSRDSQSHARFEREAKAISNISHPHICALYDVGEIPADHATNRPLRFIVMEYLEGETLEERLKRRPLHLEEIFRYGLQIVDALDKAHRKQILHRDLKPSNIMITKTGARLFDFGLAKFLMPPPDSASDSAAMSEATTSPKSITAEGSIIGTLEYMAPEQLKGTQPDARTDIFSFGVCLYQMITGRRPFHGNSRAAVIAAILDQSPPALSEYRPETPARLEWLITTCLAKDPEDRLQTARDVMLELARIADETRSGDERTSKPATRPRWLYAGIAAMIVVVAATAILFVRQRRRLQSQKPVLKHFSISLPTNAPVAMGTFEKLAVSADGSKIVYVGGYDPTNLYVYSLDTLETKLLPHTEGGRGPFFSPDGQWVGFYTAAREVKKIDLVRGASALVTSNRDLRGATWGPDDTIIFAEPRSPLRKVSALGGRIENLTPYHLNREIRWPSFLPGGESVLYTVSDFSGDYETARLVVSKVKTGQSTVILSGATCGRYVPAGYLVYFHSQSLFSVPFDVQRLKIMGTSLPLVTDVDSSFASGLADFTVSADGSLFYVPRNTEYDEELVWVNRNGSPTSVTALRQSYETPKISPDGKRVLVRIGVPPRSDIWYYDIARDTWTRLTTEGTNLAAVWSPDGRQIAFSSNRNGGFDLYTIPSDGSARARQITSGRSWDFPTSWSTDGKAIAVTEQYRATFSDIYIAEPGVRSTPVPFLATPFTEHEAVFSPDGHWIAYESNESGRAEIYVQAYPRSGRKWPVSNDGGTRPIWRRDGKELFYRNGNKMMAAATHTDSEFSADKPQMLFRGEFNKSYDVTPDGKRFIMVKLSKVSHHTQINVVVGAFNPIR